MLDIRKLIRDVPDFPKPGILFKDITPLLTDGEAWRQIVDVFVGRYRERIDLIVGIESRGFLLGSALAYALGCGHALVRKPGKLPAAVLSESYELEYGSDTLELHRDAFPAKSRILIVDDLLATGGTANAAIRLVEALDGTVVETAFLIELAFLKGADQLKPHEVFSLVQYDDE